MIYNLLASSYKKLEKSQCHSKAYRALHLLPQAKSACSTDKSCIGVYDDWCDDKPPFFLCSGDRHDISPFEVSTGSKVVENLVERIKGFSCVYAKDGNNDIIKYLSNLFC